MQRNISIPTSFKDPNDPMPSISFFHHLTITQFWTRNELVSTGPPSFSRSGINLKDTMPILEGLPISIHPIAHPYWRTSFPKAFLRSVHQRRCQRGFSDIDHKGNHQTVFFGKGNADPNFALQRIALWRSEFFLTKLQRASNSTWETFNSFTSKTSIFSLCSAATFIPYARRVNFQTFRVTIGLWILWSPRPSVVVFYAVSVRLAGTLLIASFRFRFTADTLAVRLTVPTTRVRRGLTPPNSLASTIPTK